MTEHDGELTIEDDIVLRLGPLCSGSSGHDDLSQLSKVEQRKQAGAHIPDEQPSRAHRGDFVDERRGRRENLSAVSSCSSLDLA